MLGIVMVLAFVPAPLPAAQTDDEAQAQEALWLTDRAKLKHKVHTMVIGDVDLKDVTVDQVLDFLRHKSRSADPDHQAINFVNQVQPELKAKKFSVKLSQATVGDVLTKIMHYTGIGYSISDFVVVLDMTGGDGAYTRTFAVRDNLLAINPSMLIDRDKQIYDVSSLFKAKGIQFSPGESAVYTLPAKSLTVVLDYPEEIIRVDELLVFGFKDVN